MGRRSITLHSPRFARKERRRKTRRLLFFSIFGAALTVGILYFLNTPRFLLSQVAVSGADETTRSEVKALAERTLSGMYLGLISRAHPFFYPKTELVGQVLAAFPQFSRVDISRDGLSALRLGVTLRTPAALWCSGEACAYLDANGIAFADAPTGSEQLYYRLSKENDSAGATLIGTEVLAPERLAALFAFFQQLENKGLVPLQANFTATGSVVVSLRSGARLFIQESEGYDTALKQLEVLLRESGLIPRQGTTQELNLDYIDLRYGNKVYFKPR